MSFDGINYEKGVSNPVVVAGILGAAAVLASMRGRDEAQKHGLDVNGKSMGVGGTLFSALLSVGFLWMLSYYGYTEAAWFFLLAPMGLAGLEVFAVLDMLSTMARKKCPQPVGPSSLERLF